MHQRLQHAATAIEEELSRHAASEDCANPACWSEETQDSPTFNIRTAPFGRGYFLGDYMGLDSDRSCAFLSRFASTDGIGPSSIFLAV